MKEKDIRCRSSGAAFDLAASQQSQIDDINSATAAEMKEALIENADVLGIDVTDYVT